MWIRSRLYVGTAVVSPVLENSALTFSFTILSSLSHVVLSFPCRLSSSSLVVSHRRVSCCLSLSFSFVSAATPTTINKPLVFYHHPHRHSGPSLFLCTSSLLSVSLHCLLFRYSPSHASQACCNCMWCCCHGLYFSGSPHFFCQSLDSHCLYFINLLCWCFIFVCTSFRLKY